VTWENKAPFDFLPSQQNFYQNYQNPLMHVKVIARQNRPVFGPPCSRYDGYKG